MESKQRELQKRFYYLASSIASIILLVDIVTPNNFVITYAASVISLVVIAISLILFWLKKLKLNQGNLVVIYVAFYKILNDLIVNTINITDAELFFTSIIFGLILFYTGFTLGRIHIYILSAIYLIIFLSLTIFVAKIDVSDDKIIITPLLIVAYLLILNSILNLVDDYNKKQIDSIYKLKNTNHQLETQKKELEKLNKTKDKLLSVIGHDLKNQTSGMVSFSNLMLKGSSDLPDMVKEDVDMIHRLSHRLNNLLEQLLHWARIQSGKINLTKENIDLNKVIKETIELFEATVKLKKINIIADLNEAIVIESDKQAFSILIRNLMSNALKFTPENGSISIKSEVIENQYCFSIKDTGVGMAEPMLNKILDELVIESQPGTNNEKGTGLGISIVREYIKQLNGNLGIESELNKGTTLFFTIPL